jgi:beta-lactam-binding protein with PASTA domain
MGVVVTSAFLAVGGAGGVVGATATAASTKKVPNVVGKNHQAAQNYLQSKGFFHLREKDCSGRGRLLLFDRNWKVVRQSPKAGRRVSTNSTITLCSVKYSD